ncbi:hypothetical protein A6A04_20110 [Paramagnetospirillum marisnigri]|uniref:DUF4189 domain-containing protein n=1 Tax=Paramagnetospirillum marisnigri TaxID=1285242 RepID=A0A178MIL3_9PROT|nr:DUF4189 domain-containing protein [Paramagnetospirillum marisnigri]OAN48439.1 hypothetical protein A6A04_20110 [Paramagnetospirillum marisnigri]
MKKTILAFVLALGMLAAADNSFAAGAIAVDDEQGGKAADVGYGIGSAATREEAGAIALAECKKSGNANCKIAVRYDTCGAYAASKDYSGIGWGASESIAKAKALEACGAGCKIAVSDCDK